MKASKILNDKNGDDENDELIGLSMIEKEKLRKKLARKAALQNNDSSISGNILIEYDNEDESGLEKGVMLTFK